MAVTKIHAIKSTVNKAVNYITNAGKTDGKLLVSAYKVAPETAHLEFRMTAEMAKEIRGDYTNTGRGNNLAYHLIQSFDVKDNLTPEKAHEIGVKLADGLLLNKHEYVVSTHIDKGHLHNHIIFNAVSFATYTKFVSEPYKTASKIRNISDKLCRENDLTIIDKPKGKGKSHKEWQEIKTGNSWKELIRVTIDHIIQTASSYDDFKAQMGKAGIVIKEGKHIAFQKEGMERYVRGKTIGDEYTRENILARIDKARTAKEERIENKTGASRRVRRQEFVKGNIKGIKTYPFTLDKRVVYSIRKQKIADVKELANTLLLLRRENIRNVSDFDKRVDELKLQNTVIRSDIKRLQTLNNQYKNAARSLITYNKYSEIYGQYKSLKKAASKKYYKQYESEILAFEHANDRLQELGLSTEVNVEKVIDLVNNHDASISQLNEEYRAANARIDEIRKARENINSIIKQRQAKRELDKHYKDR